MSSTPASRPTIVPPPPLVALAAWLVPGLGYWLIGERARGMTAGGTIVGLFVLGLLVAGVRVIEVPGYNDLGQPAMVQTRAGGPPEWALSANPLGEIRAKPWSIAQVLAGPVSLVSGAASVWAAGIDEARSGPGNLVPRGVKSHARVFEIGTLYTAVAGMLNLLTIIDASARAGRQPDARGATARTGGH